MTMDVPAIEAKNICFSYGNYPVLVDVNLVVRQRDFIAILGPNGGGKTTLIKIILGILTPQKGEVRILGEKPRKVLGRVGYVPQNTNINREFPISVMDVTLMGRVGRSKYGWRYSSKDKTLAREALEKVGMWEFRDHYIGELSGGQQQKVAIARALVAKPDIFIMDEPTSSIDRQSQTELYNFFRELNKEVTIVVVSHDITAISSYIKSVACVNQRLYFHDTGEITPEVLNKVYHCPVDLIAHGLPHRVFRDHREFEND